MAKRRSQSSSGGIKVGCLFSAIGGFTKAFQTAGARVLWANERDRWACMTYRNNFPSVDLRECDIAHLTVKRGRLQAVDVLTAGFPCQAFSNAGCKLGFSDERGMLFFHITRLLHEWGDDRPAFVVLENVRNLLSHDGGRTFDTIQYELRQAGYWFGPANTQVMNTAEYTAIPQHRERLFMVAASTARFASNPYRFPPKPRSIKLAAVRSFLDIRRKAPERFYFKPGDRYYLHFRAAIGRGDPDAVYQLRRNYVRENKTGRCFTLMANMGEGGHNQPVIQDRWGYRKLMPHECARLQGYGDDWFSFPEGLSIRQQYKQIGNTVTVPLVTILAEQVVRCLTKQPAVGSIRNQRRRA